MSVFPSTSPPRHFSTASRVQIVAIIAAFAVTSVAHAQLGAGVSRATRLEPTSTSAVAISEFNSGLNYLYNVQPAAGGDHMRRALDADPNLGVARVLYGMYATGLQAAQREEAINKGVADAARASTPEMLVASGFRAISRRDFAQAQTLFRSAAVILPNDPNIAFQLTRLAAQQPGNGVTETIEPLRTMITRFPDYAPGYNDLAYNLWRTGDHVNALKMIRTYVAKLPNEPNAHDSYAELLQWTGRVDEALVEYRKALELDPTFTAAATGLAETYMIQGKSDLARSAITDVLPKLTTPATKVAYLRIIAVTYLLDGNAKMVMSQYATVIAEAKAGNVPRTESLSHLEMAISDALIGDGKSVASHIGMSGTDATPIERAYLGGIAYALAKQNVPARTSLDELTKAITGNETGAVAQYVPTLTALILVNEGKGAEAVTEISKTDLNNAVTKAVLALAHQQLGNIGTARSLRDEILWDRAFSLTNGPLAMAKRMVKRIN